MRFSRLRRAQGLGAISALGLFLVASCGPAHDPAVPPTSFDSGNPRVSLGSPPPAGSVTPLLVRDFEPAATTNVRRPLVPMPSAIVTPTGTAADGDEAELAEVLLGAKPTSSMSAGIDVDVEKLANKLQLVVDSPYQIFSKTGSYIHVSAFMPNFAPAAGARVFVDGKLRGTTDPHGTIVFRDVPAATGGGGSHQIQVIAGNGAARLVGASNYNAYARTGSFEKANLYVYTDRGVFSPGETIHVRAFAWRLRGDYRPLPGAAVNFLLRRDSRVVSGGRVLTDKMGVAAVDLPLPGTLPEGSYELAVEHLGERATARLQVKRIVAPVLKIEHTLPRFLSRDLSELPFEVRIENANGDVFAGGQLVIKALDPKGLSVFSRTLTVRGSGPHKFSLPRDVLAKMRDSFVDGALAAVVIEAEDGATGRRDELRRDLRIARAPVRLVVETDRNEHVAGESVKVIVRATDLESAPVVGEEVEVSAGSVVLRAKTDTTGMATVTFPMPAMALNIVAKLTKMPAVTGSGYVSLSSPRAMFAEVTAASVKERALTPVEVSFPSGYEPVEKVVHADVVDASGSLIHAFLLPIKRDGRGYSASGSFPAPSWGSMLITFFALGVPKGKLGNPASVGLLTDGQNLPVVASRPILVTLKAPTVARAGETITVAIDVAAAPSMTRRPTELGAAIAEDAFVALLDPLERSPLDVLYNPERKVMASTGSQILTWPVVQRTWGMGGMYDIALPPFGFHAGGFMPPPPKYPPSGKYPSGGMVGGMGGAPPPMMTSKPKPSGFDDVSPPPPPPPPPAPEAAAPDIAKKSGGESKAGPFKEKADAVARAVPAGGTPPSPEVAISIRTDFSPTSAWFPHLMVSETEGSTSFRAKLSDAITTQRVTVVATDDRGAIGIGKALIRVEQDVSVRSDLPASLTEGDELEVGVAVRNTRSSPVSGTVMLTSQGLAIAGAGSSVIRVEAKSSGAVRFKISAPRPGNIPFSVVFKESAGGVAAGPLREDREERTLYVRPAGRPLESRADAPLSSATPASFRIRRESGDTLVEADLSLAFPSAVPLVEGLEDLVSEGSYFGVDPDASQLLAAIAIEGYLIRTKAAQHVIDRVHRRLQLAATQLLMAQQPDGGWGWRWDGWSTGVMGRGGAGGASTASASSPYTTSHALLALAKLRDTNVPVPDAAIAQGRTYLLSHLDADGEVDVESVGFWEGEGPAKKRAATMSAFRAIAATERGHKMFGEDLSRFEKLADKATEIVHGAAGSEDPLTLAESTLGLYLHAAASGAVKDKRDLVVDGIKSLLASYRGGYWEPSWFHAWGGRIEATRTAIELMTQAAPGVFDADLHDAVQFLLQTRPTWGAWHNAWGTAAAIEALSFLDPTPKETGAATVTIEVDGKSVRSLNIDGGDPFVSAASLRSVDLTPWLTPGDHDVKVSYSGSTKVPASLIVRRWNGSTKVTGGPIQVDQRLGSPTGKLGSQVTLDVNLTLVTGRPDVEIDVPMTAGMEVDKSDLDALVAAGTIASYRQGASLAMGLHGVTAGITALHIPVRFSRAGSFVLAPVRALAPRSSLEAYSGAPRIAIK